MKMKWHFLILFTLTAGCIHSVKPNGESVLKAPLSSRDDLHAVVAGRVTVPQDRLVHVLNRLIQDTCYGTRPIDAPLPPLFWIKVAPELRDVPVSLTLTDADSRLDEAFDQLCSQAHAVWKITVDANGSTVVFTSADD